MATSRLMSGRLARNAGVLPHAARIHTRNARPIRATPVFATAKRVEQDGSGVISGEWAPAWSLASYEDLHIHYAQQMFKSTALPASLLQDVMQRDVKSVTADMSLESVKPLLSRFSGCPVVDREQKLIGIISRKDVQDKRGAFVGEVMSTPPLAVEPTARVADAAALMLKYKMGRIPIVDKNSKVIGIISRTDIFQ